MDQGTLGTEIGLGPVDVVLEWHPAPPRKGTQQPTLFVPLLWPASQQARILLVTHIVE